MQILHIVIQCIKLENGELQIYIQRSGPRIQRMYEQCQKKTFKKGEPGQKI